MPRRRTATAIQVLNSALQRVAIKDNEPPREGAGVKTKEIKTKRSITVPKEKKAQLINTRVLLTR